MKMSTAGRTPSNQPLRPKLASGGSAARSPLTPRLATRSTPGVRSEPLAPHIKQSNQETPTRDVLSNGNVTPRSSVRSSKIGSSNNTPTQTNTTPSAPSSRPTTAVSSVSSDRNGGTLGQGGVSLQSKARIGRPKSTISDSGSGMRPQARLSPALIASQDQTTTSSVESRFFHASEAPKQEAAPKRPEPKKLPSFVYADGQREDSPGSEAGATSPAVSAVSEQRSTGPWARLERPAASTKSPPLLSPNFSVISQSSSFFSNSGAQDDKPRPPSPSKENIHLSYRRGASQIFGTRPLPTTRPSNDGSPYHGSSLEPPTSPEHSLTHSPHRRSPSLSSIDSGNSPPSHRRTTTTIDMSTVPSPLMQELRSGPVHRVLPPLTELPSINTSLEQPTISSPPPESSLSPTKGISGLAAEARRERKVLDLEISNSSLLAINSSLEREVRRQKAELKRFRRLSRAGRFSFGSVDRTARLSEGLSAVGEEDEDDDGEGFGLGLGLTDIEDDGSDDDDDSLDSSTEPSSPSSSSRRDSDRLAKDEKRLQIDLERHKELLVQSQMMNQSIKRCMYATEDMIQEGKKALDYHVRVSDVKLGGRVLSQDHEDEDESEIHDIGAEDAPEQADGVDDAKGFMDVWSGLGRPSYDSSDRDSGIEVEKSAAYLSLPLTYTSSNADLGRPPDVGSLSATLA